MANAGGEKSDQDLDKIVADVARHPLNTVSTQQLEAALTKALAELAPTPDHNYRVVVNSLDFGPEQALRGPAKVSLTVWNTMPIGDILGGRHCALNFEAYKPTNLRHAVQQLHLLASSPLLN